MLDQQCKARMPAIWAATDVSLVLLKRNDLFKTVIPSKIFEAMGMGLPILIAAPAGEATRLVESEGAGLAVAPEDPAALAGAVRRLAGDPELRRKLGQAALAAAPRHSRATQAESMMAVFARVTARAGR
jgi:glycosyltransferase involved in cell wall biosynthesis